MDQTEHQMTLPTAVKVARCWNLSGERGTAMPRQRSSGPERWVVTVEMSDNVVLGYLPPLP